MAWLAGWTRRRIKVVENLTIPDYQMKLIVHKSGLGPDSSTDIYLGDHCRDDFADLRFTDPDQTTLLSYWIESITSGVATVMIKIPTLVPINNIYIYYDNPIAPPVSNGPATFDHFDEFDAVLGAQYSTRAGSWSSGTGKLVNNQPGSAENGKFQLNNKTFTDMALDIKVNNVSNDTTWLLTRFDGTWGNDWWGNSYQLDLIPSYSRLNKHTSGTNTQIGTNGPGITGNAWHDISFRVTGNNLSVYIDGSIAISGTDSSYNSGRIAILSHSPPGAVVYNYDTLRVRKYTSPEPTFGVSGNEELNITAIDPFTLSSNICIGPCSITAGVTWQNLGSSSITFTPAILIDGTTMVYSMDITIPAGETGSSLITTPILSIGSHVICPYPN